jgi:hypothetical protein
MGSNLEIFSIENGGTLGVKDKDMESTTPNPNGSAWRWRSVFVAVLVIGVLAGASLYQYQQLQTQTTYEQQARFMLAEMYTTMVLAEEINVTRYGVIYQSQLYPQVQTSNIAYVPLWTRVINNDPKTEEKDPKTAYNVYVWKNGVGYLPVEQAVANLLRDPEYRAKIATMREQSVAIAKRVRALQPVGRSTSTYQKIIRLHAFFQQYSQNTAVPLRNTLLNSSSQYDIASAFMLLNRELNDELP